MSFLTRSELGRAMLSYRREFVWVGVFSFFTNVLLLAPTLYMLQVFDRVMLSRSELTLAFLTAIVLFLFGVNAFAEWIRSRLLVRIGVRFDERLSPIVFRAGFAARFRGEGGDTATAFNDLTTIRQFVTGQGVFAFFDVPWTPIYVAVLFLMHPLLGWTAVGFLSVLLCMGFLGGRSTEPALERAMHAGRDSGSFIAAKLRNSEVIEAMGMLGNLRVRWLHFYERHLDLHVGSQHAVHRVQALSKFVRYSQQSVVLAVGAWLVIHGELSAGAMVASNTLIANALRPVDMLVSAWQTFLQSRTAYLRLEKLVSENPEPVVDDHPMEGLQSLDVKDLFADSVDGRTAIIRGVTTRLEAARLTVIVGPSGAGKTTLLRCLMGMWPGQRGSVAINGVELTRWSRESLGPHVGYLPQDVELFDGSVAENIARAGAVDPELVIEAAKRAGVHEMILALPKGYDTPVGEAGGRLSGGQRQRLGLARALYGTPKLLFLDEPNANLDDVGEASLMQAVADMKRAGSLICMVVHNKRLMSMADRLVVVDAGRVVQDRQITTA